MEGDEIRLGSELYRDGAEMTWRSGWDEDAMGWNGYAMERNEDERRMTGGSDDDGLRTC